MKQFKTKLEQLMGDEYPEDVLEFVPMMIILDSSEILISSVGQIDEDNLCLMYPYKLLPAGISGETFRMSISRFVPGSDDVFYHLDSRKVTTMGFLDEDLYNLYEDAVAAYVASIIKEEEKAEEKSEVDSPAGNVLSFPGPNTVH